MTEYFMGSGAVADAVGRGLQLGQTLDQDAMFIGFHQRRKGGAGPAGGVAGEHGNEDMPVGGSAERSARKAAAERSIRRRLHTQLLEL